MTNATTAKPEFTVISSRASECRKALYLDITGAEPSNPPDDRAQSLMDLGMFAQRAATNSMRRQGWTVDQVTDEYSVNLQEGGHVKVAPKILASHPEITEGQMVAVKAVSASNTRFKNWETAGPLSSHPDAYTDLAFMFYTMGMKSIVDAQQPQVLAILNRENGQVETDLIEVEDLERRFNGVKRRLEEMAQVMAKGEVPEAEYTRNSNDCRYCKFLDLCHGPEPKRRPRGPLSNEELEGALEIYAEAEDALATTKQFNNPRKKAMDTVKKYLQENKVPNITGRAGGRDWVATISTSEPKPTLNEEKLMEVLTDEQKALVYEDQSTERLSIRPIE